MKEETTTNTVPGTGRAPELLAPAGDMERLQMAVRYGADAVYLAGTTFGMRSFAGNFEDDGALEEAVRFAHAHGGEPDLPRIR